MCHIIKKENKKEQNSVVSVGTKRYSIFLFQLMKCILLIAKHGEGISVCFYIGICYIVTHVKT